jgi:hypothetical protein
MTFRCESNFHTQLSSVVEVEVEVEVEVVDKVKVIR